MDRLSDFLYAYSHLGVFLALLSTGLGLPVPEDIILITGGVIAEQTDSLLWMNAICMAGVLLGDLTIYAMGYRFGEALLTRRPFSWLVTPERIRKVRQYYRKYGYWAIFISRFLAGLRATSFLLAGLSHVPLRVFLLADGIAALISVPFFIFLGYYFSDNIQVVMGYLAGIKAQAGWIIAVLVGILVLSWLWKRRRSGGEEAPEPPDEPSGD